MDMEKVLYTNKKYSKKAVLERAVKALADTEKEDFHKLPGVLKDVACKGKFCEFQFNHIRIRYNIKDNLGQFCLYWLVTNAISGHQEFFYNKGWVDSKGQVRWQKLAKAMRCV